jgi:hypothetical protein
VFFDAGSLDPAYGRCNRGVSTTSAAGFPRRWRVLFGIGAKKDTAGFPPMILCAIVTFRLPLYGLGT